ncbi:MAG: AbrB/MazE/SpoVT family DNA-binding domain-containing protein [Candidatus Lokiarchaeota archaeon]|nr:AbrB/MazE/SpoVT family DNA-binding domain-containing protein [Candidatus Lokiarchaeota archaeon]MBD3341583.1 AbrB/MazE/SpoVT family DNA-binding domain-containing protein [Candidatus Lokiarchaeota archaeon]
MEVGKMSKKGQIVIPKEIRKKFGIQPGDALIFDIQGDKITISKIEEKMSEILENSKPVENSVEFQRKLRNEWK